MTGKTKASQENLENIHDKKDVEFFKEAGKKGGEAKKKRSSFKEVFELLLDDDTQKIIAKDFIDAILDKDLPIKARLQVFNTVLSVIGEAEPLTSNEFQELSSHIELKIV